MVLLKCVEELWSVNVVQHMAVAGQTHLSLNAAGRGGEGGGQKVGSESRNTTF